MLKKNMKKINIYLFILTNRYLFINFIIISLFILFINILELSRIISENDKNLFNFLYLSFLRYPSILNEIVPFVTIISVTFLVRNLINNNEFISMRNLGYSIFDIFIPISLAVFTMGLIFLLILNPLAVFMESEYDTKLDYKDNSIYSIKISDNEMWIKNNVDALNSSFINIKNIDLKDMKAEDIKILLINSNSNKFLLAEKGEFKENLFLLKNVKYYNFINEDSKNLDNYNLIIKLHHYMNDLLKLPIFEFLSTQKHVYVFRPIEGHDTLNSHDIIRHSDIVISDTSGLAITAISLNKKLIFLEPDSKFNWSNADTEKKFRPGYIVNNTHQIKEAINAYSNSDIYEKDRQDFLNILFPENIKNPYDTLKNYILEIV